MRAQPEWDPHDLLQSRIARRHHATVLHRGKCIGGEFCNFIWMPVCAFNPFTQMKQTYPNLCVAEHDNAVWMSNGPCP